MDAEHRHGMGFSPVLIGLLGVVAGAIVVATYYFIAVGCCNRRPATSRPNGGQGPQTGQEDGPSSSTCNSMVQLLPIFRYSKECEGETSCAVCLCEFQEAEEIRVLPECLHLFHVTCIDTWLKSHSNCPLCRADTLPPVHAVLSLPNTPPSGIHGLQEFSV